MIAPDYAPVAQQGEVAEVFSIPLRHALDLKHYRLEGRHWQGRMRHYYVVPYGSYYIWGATARILHAFAKVMENAD